MSKTIRYVAVGDSLTVGVGAPPGYGFADQYRRLVEKALNAPVRLFNAGVSGETSGQIWERVRSDRDLRKRLQEADVVTLTVGGNDLLEAAKQFYTDSSPQHLIEALKQCQNHLSAVCRDIRTLKNGQSYLFRLTDLYNPIPYFEESIYWVEKFNAMYHRMGRKGLKVADVYGGFLGRIEELLSDDLIHPNAAGYTVMAEAVGRLGFTVS